jgi:hypothetical protein
VNLIGSLFDFLSGSVSRIVIALAPLSLTSTGYFPELNRSTLSEIFPQNLRSQQARRYPKNR